MHKSVAVYFIATLLIASTLLPNTASARAGGGRSSMGSRGSQTYVSPAPSAAPIQRTTAAPSVAQPGVAPAAAPAVGTGHPFLSGIAGGFLGAGLASMLFGHSFMGGMGGGMGLLPILLIAGVGYFFYRMLRSGSGAALPMSAGAMPMGAPASAPIGGEKALNLTEADQAAFEQILEKIQRAWSGGDLTRLRQYVTPEMLQYFSEELSANSSKGLANIVENVHLEQGDIIESWSEYALDYATTQLRWSALDYMVRLDRTKTDADYIASGSQTVPVTAEEYWTFARTEGGNWVLSAIQQLQ